MLSFKTEKQNREKSLCFPSKLTMLLILKESTSIFPFFFFSFFKGLSDANVVQQLLIQCHLSCMTTHYMTLCYWLHHDAVIDNVDS